MEPCFVIQPFDGSKYDNRYKETFAPAIERGGAKPQRADEIVGTKPVVEKIVNALERTSIAFSEITEDNGNVFFELGFALACNIPTVLVCDREVRPKAPFDIAHRPIIFYDTSSRSSFDRLSEEIEKNVVAALQERRQQRSDISLPASNPSADMDDLRETCLLAILEQGLKDPAGASLWYVQREVSDAGVNDRLVALALSSLVANEYIFQSDQFDQDVGESYSSFKLTDKGNRYILEQYRDLKEKEEIRLAQVKGPKDASSVDDDIPF